MKKTIKKMWRKTKGRRSNMTKEKNKFEKIYELSDKRILYIREVINGYYFVLYTKDKEILNNGLLKTKTEKTIRQVLEELFGYFNIRESEIKNLKIYKGKVRLPDLDMSEIIEY